MFLDMPAAALYSREDAMQPLVVCLVHGAVG